MTANPFAANYKGRREKSAPSSGASCAILASPRGGRYFDIPIATQAGCANMKTSPNPVSQEEKKALAYAKKGIILALASGMIFSLDGLAVKRSEAYSPFNDERLWILAALVCAGVHDVASAVCASFMNWKSGRLKEVGRGFLSRPGRYVIIGALFGAILGMGGYMGGLKLAGPAYILPITSLYPAIASVLAVWILKEKISPRAWAGLALCIAGAVIIGYTKPETQTGEMFYLGLLLAGMAAVGWGAEGVCAASGMDFIEPEVALNMYYLVSSFLYLTVIIPAALIMLPSAGSADDVAAFAGSPGLLFVILAGCVGSFSYRFWYKAMNMTGVSRAMALNISYALWGILFSAMFTKVEITANLVAGAMVIFAGMFLVIGNPRDMLDLRKVD